MYGWSGLDTDSRILTVYCSSIQKSEIQLLSLYKLSFISGKSVPTFVNTQQRIRETYIFTIKMHFYFLYRFTCRSSPQNIHYSFHTLPFYCTCTWWDLYKVIYITFLEPRLNLESENSHGFVFLCQIFCCLCIIKPVTFNIIPAIFMLYSIM